MYGPDASTVVTERDVVLTPGLNVLTYTDLSGALRGELVFLAGPDLVEVIGEPPLAGRPLGPSPRERGHDDPRLARHGVDAAALDDALHPLHVAARVRSEVVLPDRAERGDRLLAGDDPG